MSYAEQVKQENDDRGSEYAAGVLSTPGQFLSASNGQRYGEQRLNGICGHDARRDREWLLSLVENPRRMVGAIEWVRP